MPFTSENDVVPGVPIYKWDNWPDGLKTKKQLSEAGFQTGKLLPPVAGVIRRSKSPDGWLRLYDPAQATPKRKPSPAQLAALEKAAHMAERVTYSCPVCGQALGEVSRKRYQANPGRYARTCHICRDRVAMIEWARDTLETGGVILDTETTDLRGDIIQIGICDMTGRVLLDSYVATNKEITPGAFAVHGITPAMLADAPTFTQIHGRIYDALHGRQLIIYNWGYDWPLLFRHCRRHGLPYPRINGQHCAMEAYSMFCGDWNDYYQDYRWQRLPGGDHTAIGDCLATLAVIRRMAAYDTEKPYQEPEKLAV